jgi:iron-sulfur cluster protein
MTSFNRNETPLATPRDVANKSSKGALVEAIRMALAIESVAVRRNTQSFNRGRYLATADIVDYEALKDRARAIKENAIEHLPDLLNQLEKSVTAKGGHFYIATDAADASRYILRVCQDHRAVLVVKSKSITSEEIKLNPVLEKMGIEVAETDLAEFILQVADEQPSHIVAPAIHYTRERISELFRRVFATNLPLETGEDLTRFARDRLREKFFRADVGITGANFIAADSGTLVLVESEANIRLVTMAPPVHIAIAGIEKVVPTRADFGPFIELLAASATGQPMTSYTSVISPPSDIPSFSFEGREKKQREFYLVLVDNGRFRMRQDSDLREALYCIRCSACLNSCANFQAVGGHAFGGETYSGGIGGSWEAGTGRLQNARFSDLCTGCSRCVPQCPVRIDIPWLNIVLRDRLNQTEAKESLAFVYDGLMPTAAHDKKAPLQKQFFGNYHFFAKWGSRFAPFSNWANQFGVSRILLEKLVGLDRRSQPPPFASKPLVKLYRDRQKQGAIQRQSVQVTPPRGKVLLVADVFTNYGYPSRGIAAIEVLEAVGINVALSAVLPDGRDALSQGMIATATERAIKMAAMLAKYIEEGRDVVVIEPSVHALFRLDYEHLLADRTLFEKLREHTYDPVEYLQKFLQERGLAPRDFFRAERFPHAKELFFHSHCQQKTIGSARQTEALLRAVGFDVVTSEVECCGMAGSFGYKKQFYEVSRTVGQDLLTQIRTADEKGAQRTLVASGISCYEQIHNGVGRPVFHPMEVLAAAIALQS